MSRGGFRQGAGRKKEYTEPVKKILLGLPESVLEELDQFAVNRKLSRPKAVAELLKLVQEKPPTLQLKSVLMEELRELQNEFETLLDNAPVREDDGVNVAFVQRQKDHGEEFDRHGRPVRYPFAYAFTKTLSDPSGGTDALGGRHQMKMRELTPAAGLPTRTIANLRTTVGTWTPACGCTATRI